MVFIILPPLLVELDNRDVVDGSSFPGPVTIQVQVSLRLAPTPAYPRGLQARTEAAAAPRQSWPLSPGHPAAGHPAPLFSLPEPFSGTLSAARSAIPGAGRRRHRTSRTENLLARDLLL